ncbi:MAG: APC family permease [Coriobacteriaceae bacterium]|nr:APC family permease [Coriobacteriaceae bacterium]
MPTPQTTTHQTPAMTERYSLTTAICLIVGICIGSGIFFKSDNILVATGGNVALGAIMFLLAATTIIFGGLTLARFAARTNGHGGLIAYAQEFLSPRFTTFIGWHYTFMYMPVICSVVSWVVGVYACMTFGLPASFPLQIAIGVVFLIVCTAWNILWPTLSGYFQNVTTIAKALPLVAVGVIGLLFADPATQLSTDLAAAPTAGFGWLAAAAPIAFAFDGWSSAVSIAPELKDAHRNLPRALVVAPIIILVLYLGYFLGLSCYLGPQTVIEAGDASLSLLFARLFGEQAAVLPNVIALVAVLGTANGMVLAMLRMPFALALHNQVPCSDKLRHMSPTLNFPVRSALVALASALLWIGVHFVVTTFGLLPNGDVSEIAVGLTMIFLTGFYLFSLKESFRLEATTPARLRRAVAPAIAIVSSLAVGLSSISDPSRWPFVVAHVAVLVAATWAVNRTRA